MSKQSTDSSSEQSSYSVDEMMARLRDGEREKRQQDEGELVTRPDGTQVLRVRRRKRRSKQTEVSAKKRTKRSRKFVIPLILGLVVLLGLGAMLLVAKYNSKGFQDMLEGGLGEVTGSKISIKEMSVTPITVRAGTVLSEWEDGSMLEGMELAELEADLTWTSFLKGVLGGSRIQASHGVLQIGTGGASGVPQPTPSENPVINYNELRCQALDIRYGEEKSSSALLKGTQATLLTPDDDPTQVLFRGGELILDGWSPMAVDNGIGQMTKEGFELKSFRIVSSEGTGELNLTTTGPVRSAHPVELNVEMSDFPIEDIVGSGLGRLLSGAANSEAGRIVFGNDGRPGVDARIKFSGTSGSMSGLPVWEGLNGILGKNVRPEFDAFQGVFQSSATGMTLQALEWESAGRLRVRGFLELSPDDELSGTLEIGISKELAITATGRKRNNVFSDLKDGYCWVILTVSGDANRPDDDFKNLLENSARPVDERRNERSGGDRFDELTRPR